VVRSAQLLACSTVLLAGTASTAHAQFGGLAYSALGGNVVIVLPTGDLQERWKVGFGGGLMVEPRINDHWAVAFEFGATHLIGKTVTVQGSEQKIGDINFWELSSGPRYAVRGGRFVVGVDAAYILFSVNGSLGVDDQFGLLPSIGFRGSAVGLNARYKLLGDAHWAQLRLTFRGLL
jgi:hypothetical protein